MFADEKRYSDASDMRCDIRICLRVVTHQTKSIRQQQLVELLINPPQSPPLQPFTRECEIDIRTRPVGSLGSRPKKQSALDL